MCRRAVELQLRIETTNKGCNQKPSPRPVVGLPLAATFQECIAMDLKFHKKRILLHLIYHTTQLSSWTVWSHLKTQKMLSKLFLNFGHKCMVWPYGSAEKIMSDNGSEFAN